MNIVNHFDMEKLNSATAYPSILTWHKLGDRGRFINEVNADLQYDADKELYVTEKVDGTNTRIVLCGDDYLIGSRDAFIYAKGDRIKSPDSLVRKIIERVIPVAEKCLNEFCASDDLWIRTIYGEAYGGKILSGSKVYGDSDDLGFRVFDIMKLDSKYVLQSPIQQICYDRDHETFDYAQPSTIQFVCKNSGTDFVPYRAVIKESELPLDIEEAARFLLDYKKSLSLLCDVGNGNQKFGRAEGVVVRSADRKFIRKLRFEDYSKTLGKDLYQEGKNSK